MHIYKYTNANSPVAERRSSDDDASERECKNDERREEEKSQQQNQSPRQITKGHSYRMGVNSSFDSDNNDGRESTHRKIGSSFFVTVKLRKMQTFLSSSD